MTRDSKVNELKITEREFMQQVIDLAQLCGWRVAHFRPGMMQSGKWVTPIQADAAGFPDLCLVRQANEDEEPASLIFMELKSEKGRLTEAQARWLWDLNNVLGVVAMVAKPSDWEEIVEELR